MRTSSWFRRRAGGAPTPPVHMLGRTVDNRRSAGREASNRVHKENTARPGTTSFSPGAGSDARQRSEFTRRLRQVQPAKQGIGEVRRNLPTCAQPVKLKLEMPLQTFFTTPTFPQVTFFPAPALAALVHYFLLFPADSPFPSALRSQYACPSLRLSSSTSLRPRMSKHYPSRVSPISKHRPKRALVALANPRSDFS